MKTMNLKKAASVMVLASVATVMSAQIPEKLFNDELAGKRVTVREVCAKTDMGYVKSVRSEMTYSDKGELNRAKAGSSPAATITHPKAFALPTTNGDVFFTTDYTD